MSHFVHTFFRRIEVAFWRSRLCSADPNVSWFSNRQAPSHVLFCCRLSRKCMCIPFFSGFCLFPVGSLSSLHSAVLWDIGKLGRPSSGSLVKFKPDLVLEPCGASLQFCDDIIVWRYGTLRKKANSLLFSPRREELCLQTVCLLFLLDSNCYLFFFYCLLPGHGV